jgi:fused signal recognition particle receptor
MFSFFRKKNPAPAELADPHPAADAAPINSPPATERQGSAQPADSGKPAAMHATAPEQSALQSPPSPATTPPSSLSAAVPSPEGLGPAPAAVALAWLKRTFSQEPAPLEETAEIVAQPTPPVEVERISPPIANPVLAPPAERTTPAVSTVVGPSALTLPPASEANPQLPDATAIRARWLDRLRSGLKKTGSGITTVFTGTRIDEALYEELEDALLLADTGVKATQFLLLDLKRRVKEAKATEVSAVRGLLADAIADLLRPLEKALVIGEHLPTVIMVAGVNGAGKTTSIGKLTHHLAQEGASVLLAAADTFRAAAREQLGVWATRNTVEIVGNQGGDPAAVSFDAVKAGKARGKDVVLVDTAGRLPTQVHLMEELKKIRRVVQKADPTAPHEVLLVIDGNTGQNALAQVRAFDDALQLTGLIVTKLDGTAKGGVLAAIAQERPIPVYFIGVGESVLDLETFNAREFAQALLG